MKKIISIISALALIASLCPLNISAENAAAAASPVKKVYKVFECEDNGVEIIYNGENIAASHTYTSDAASGGKYLRSNLSSITWKFTPDKTGFYGFELHANGDLPTGDSTFWIDDASSFTGTINTTGSWLPQNAIACNVGRFYLSQGREYTLKLNANNGTMVLDYFNIYFEETYDAELGTTAQLTSAYTAAGASVTGEVNPSANLSAVYTIPSGSNVRITTNITEKGMYGISVRGYSDTAVNARVRIDEKVSKASDSGMVTIVPQATAIPASGTNLTYKENIVALYMDEGEKIVSLIINGGSYSCDYITICKLDMPPAADNYIEAECYERSDDKNCTKAFTGMYDAVNCKILGGVSGSMLDLEYKFFVPVTGTYKFKTIGAAKGDASVVSISVDAEYAPISSRVSSGDSTLQTDIGQLELNAGYHTFKLTADNAITLDAIMFEREQNATDILINAETDYDKYAGHGVGWYDTTPNGYDDAYQVRDTYGYVDVYKGTNSSSYYYNNVGQATVYMIDNEWFRYTVDVEKSGYYRLLLGIKNIKVQSGGSNSKITITVNGNDENAITKAMPARDNYWISNPLPWDDFGLVYLNSGTNTIKVKYDNASGSAEFDAFRLVHPDMSLYSYIEGEKVTIEAEAYTDTTAQYVNDERIVVTPLQYIAITFEAPKDGTYTLTAIANGDTPSETATATAQLYVDGVSIGTTAVNTSGSWSPQVTPLETEFPALELKEGTHILKFVTGEGFSIAYDKFIIECPDEDNAATNLSAGKYKVVADLNDWYAGYTNTGNGTRIDWASEGEIDKLAVIAAIYNGTLLKSTVVCDEVNSNNQAVLKGIDVEAGDTLKVFIWDSYDVKPLVNYTIYN